MAQRSIDAAVYSHKKNRGYFFEGSKYYRFEPGARVDPGYPKPIAGNWKRLPASFASGIDAAVEDPTNRKLYLFKGRQYVRFTLDRGMDAGYPKPIHGNWDGFPAGFSNGVDAATNSKDGKMYFFNGTDFLRYTFGVGVDDGYPRLIKGGWKEFKPPFTEKVEAALWWPPTRRFFFFNGDQFIRYTPGPGVHSGYPKTIDGSNWEGLFRRYSQDTLGELLEDQLWNKLDSDWQFYYGDDSYYLPEMADVKDVVDASTLDAWKYTSEIIDCDDFAFMLKSEFVRNAYHQKKRRLSHAAGIVWGDLPGPHAMNWVVTSPDLRVWFIEPQSDEIIRPQLDFKKIYLMVA